MQLSAMTVSALREAFAVDEVSIDIDAPPERVWDLVTDVTAMGRWSPGTASEA